MPPARPARRRSRAEVPGNVCLDWQTGDAAAADAAFAAARHVVTLRPRQPPHRHQPDGAARRGRHVRSGERPLHAPRLQPEHPRQPRPRRPRARRRADGRALHRARCRRRLRRQELRLCRACAGPVGGQAHRPAGEMDRHAAARSSCPTIRRATCRPRRRWRSTPTGRFLALRVASVANLGAYMVGGGGGVQTYQYVHLQGTVYRIPAIALHVAAVLTNTTPIGVTARAGLRRDGQHPGTADRRGGRTQCGFDRAELRRRNMVPADAMPMTNAFGFQVDSGDFRRDLRPGARRAPTSRASPARRQRERGARQAARPGLRLSHQGHRRRAATRTSTSASSPTARCR